MTNGILKKWFENLRIKYKLIVAFSLVMLLVMVFIHVYFPYKQKQSVYKELNLRIQTWAETAALGLGIFFKEQTYTAWSEISDRLKKEPDFAYILISNAIKFTSREGRVTVALKVMDTDETGKYLEFSVSDTGIGIPAAHIPQLFDMYSRVSQKDTDHRLIFHAKWGILLS